jgi:hypothetical protein
MVRSLADLHEKKGGRKIPLLSKVAKDNLVVSQPLPIVNVKTVTAATKGYRFRPCFVRSDEVRLDPADLGRLRGKLDNSFFDVPSFFLAAGAVHIIHVHEGSIVLAGGSVEFGDNKRGTGEPHSLVIVSGGDVKCHGPMSLSLVIARGEIDCHAYSHESRFIAGKSVSFDEDRTVKCIVTENDPNPLGFIRWSDAPKEKAAPKTK